MQVPFIYQRIDGRREGNQVCGCRALSMTVWAWYVITTLLTNWPGGKKILILQLIDSIDLPHLINIR